MNDSRKRRAAAVLAAVLFEEESDEEDVEEDEEEFVVLSAAAAVLRRKRVCAEDYFRTTVHRLVLEEFRNHFRLSRGTVQLILERLAACPGFAEPEECPGRERVPLEKQLLVVIWLLGNQETFRSVSDRFDLARSTTHRVFRKVCNALSCKLGKTVIRWPRGRESQNTMEGFRASHRFPRVVGAIDGTYIPITAPTEDPLSYMNRKGFHCIILQGVCDDEMLFTNVFARFPGSVHDARVLRRSSLLNEIQEDPSMFPSNSHLLGLFFCLSPSPMADGALQGQREPDPAAAALQSPLVISKICH